MLFSQVIIAAEEQITVTQVESNTSNIYIKVTSKEKIDNVRLYKENNNKQYFLFFNAKNIGEKEKIYSISSRRLSTEKETHFKIIITDEKGNKVEKIITADKITEVVRPEPSESPTISPSVLPSPSTIPSPEPSTQPSTQPSTVPTTTPSESTPAIQESIKLNKTSLTLKRGTSETLKATVITANANKKVTWKSSNHAVVSVNSNGKVTAKGIGTAKITATSSSGKTATCVVTIKNNISSQTKPQKANGDGYTQTITLGGRKFKLYKQTFGSYCNRHFNSVNNSKSGGTIASMGCGPSSIAIILSGYGYKYNPYEIGKKLMKNHKPSGLPSMKKEVTALGRKAKIHYYNANYQKSYNEMKSALAKGHQIVLYVGKKAPKSYWYNFTHSGYHFISLLGIDESNNKVFVGNPSVNGGWFKLSTIVKARGNTNGNMAGWLEIY